VKVIGLVLVLAVAARLHVTVWLPGGVPVSVPALEVAAAVVTVPVAAAVWFAWSAPRRGWPRLVWGSVTA
jgi:hypothetical protein